MVGMTINDAHQVVNDLLKIVRDGDSTPIPVNTAQFVTQADIVLRTGYNPVIEAISQVMHKTIFSVRNYNPLFKGLRRTPEEYGNHVRKVTPLDKPFTEDESFDLTDGESKDMFTINKPEVIQTNFYGFVNYEKFMTVSEIQLRNAFLNESQLSQFFSTIFLNAKNQISQAHEELERALVCNFIAAKTLVDNRNVVDVLALYNTITGEQFTASDIKKPENYPGFAKWLFAYIKTLAQLLRVRSNRYHLNIANADIPRFTPARNLNFYMFAPEINNIEASVLSDVYHDDYLKLIDFTAVPFWQNPDTPMSIAVTPSYTDADGKATDSEAAVEVDNILGALFDEEAMGYAPINERSYVTPFNVKGEYYNQFWKWRTRYWNDLTENAIILTLGSSSSGDNLVGSAIVGEAQAG